jgi:hypothetical protein
MGQLNYTTAEIKAQIAKTIADPSTSELDTSVAFTQGLDKTNTQVNASVSKTLADPSTSDLDDSTTYTEALTTGGVASSDIITAVALTTTNETDIADRVTKATRGYTATLSSVRTLPDSPTITQIGEVLRQLIVDLKANGAI